MSIGSPWDWREWRVVPGDDVPLRGGVHIHAIDPRSGDSYVIATFVSDRAEQLAEQVVREHSMLSAPYADDQHLGGHWLELLPQKPRWAPQAFAEPIQMALTRAESWAELMELRKRIDQRLAELEQADEGVAVSDDEP